MSASTFTCRLLVHISIAMSAYKCMSAFSLSQHLAPLVSMSAINISLKCEYSLHVYMSPSTQVNINMPHHMTSKSMPSAAACICTWQLNVSLHIYLPVNTLSIMSAYTCNLPSTYLDNRLRTQVSLAYTCTSTFSIYAHHVFEYNLHVYMPPFNICGHHTTKSNVLRVDNWE